MSITVLSRVSWSLGRRCISTSAPRLDVYTIQDEDDFKAKVIEAKKPVVVDFFATWCGPCKMLTPRLETFVGVKGDKIDLAKVDVDNHENLAAQYKVSSVPTVFAVKNGKVMDSFVGNKDDDELKAFVEKISS